MIRCFDIFFAIVGLLLLSPILIVLIIMGFFDTGSPFFLQERVGKNKKAFKLIKFRSMFVNTKSVATHLASASFITKHGKFLRASKLDELPQLLNVLLGDMSLVGPRPNLFNQEELILERDKFEIYKIKPGVTGLAQINKIDMSTPELLARTDAGMIANFGVKTYFTYIFATIMGKGSGDRITN
jgi:lipopolysaccharide/colanic/teichoic acid biosynthesis glycosyltransferase